jgi:aryl-alcohol dehydrogenase-like predicted oxidoreductase
MCEMTVRPTPTILGPDGKARLLTLHQVAKETGWTVNQVVLVWLLQHSPFTLPLVSAGTMEQLKENLSAAELTLSPEQLQRLDNAGV